MQHSPLTQTVRSDWQTIVLGIAVAGVIALFGVLVFIRSRDVMREELQQRLRSTAAAAAMQFDGAWLEGIATRADMQKPMFTMLVSRLREIRDRVPNIRYAYIMRQTKDRNAVAFVADANSLTSPSQQDTNHNGVIDPDEALSLPGDPYDVSTMPDLREGFLRPSADRTITTDQWGSFVSGYAPIVRRDTGAPVAVLGLDMDSGEFAMLSNGILSPLAIFLLFIGTMTLTGSAVSFVLQRRVQELRRLDEERAGLMLLTFHQLGGPLTIFKWSLETLQNPSPGETLEQVVHEHIANMQHGLVRMDGMLNDLKGAAQVQEGRIDFDPRESDLSTVIIRVAEKLKSPLEKQRLSLVLELDADLRMGLDEKLTTYVLDQLLTNAVTFSPPGSVITVSARRHLRHAQVEVEDHGCGIPKRDMPRLFGKFVRASNAAMYKPDGNGLGLFIARGLIERAGGSMSAKSEEGKGTTITFTLPLHPVR